MKEIKIINNRTMEEKYRKFSNDKFLQRINNMIGEVYATACPVGLLVDKDGTPKTQYDCKTRSLIEKLKKDRKKYIESQYPELIKFQ